MKIGTKSPTVGAPMNVEGEAQVKAASGEDTTAARRAGHIAPRRTAGDVDIQDRHGVKYMAYWFDENNGAAFCLVHAPDPATAERVHREGVRSSSRQRAR
jgi:Protein of unknown function (DUF4242)